MYNLKLLLINLGCHIDDRGFLYQIYGQYNILVHRIKNCIALPIALGEELAIYNGENFLVELVKYYLNFEEERRKKRRSRHIGSTHANK